MYNFLIDNVQLPDAPAELTIKITVNCMKSDCKHLNSILAEMSAAHNNKGYFKVTNKENKNHGIGVKRGLLDYLLNKWRKRSTQFECFYLLQSFKTSLYIFV